MNIRADGATFLEIEQDAAGDAHLDPRYAGGLSLAVRSGNPFDLLIAPFRVLAERDLPLLPTSSGWSALAAMTWFQRPFSFAIGEHAIEHADEALRWLSGNERWKRHDGGFYKADVVSVDSLDPPAPCDILFDANGHAELERAASQLFEEPLRLHGPIAIHRMVSPQGIGIHSDAPVPGEETHRIVVLLADHWTPPQGGHFVLLKQNTPLSAQVMIPLAHNTALAFRLTEHSFHAITTVTGGFRFSIVASFRKR